MPPRGFTNPAPKTESARSALSSFTCSLCNKSYSRHPEYEAHISSYDHQHRKRLQELKQLSRDPNAAEKARRAEKRADAEAGLRVIDTNKSGIATGSGTRPAPGSGGSSGGFKKGGFKSSFTTVKAPAPSSAPTRKNVLGGDDDDSPGARETDAPAQNSPARDLKTRQDTEESDTDEEYANDIMGGGYYNPRRPTGCFVNCGGIGNVESVSAKG